MTIRTVAILVDLTSYRLTGIPHLVAQLLDSLASNSISTVLVIPKADAGLDLFHCSAESYPQPDSRLDVCSLPFGHFTRHGRDQLLHELERVIASKSVDHIVAIGIQRGGYVATIAARLRGITISAWILHDDAFGSPRNQAAEMEEVIKTATLVSASSPDICRYLDSCYDGLGGFRYVDVSPSPHFILPDSNDGFSAAKDLPECFLATTGVLSRFVDYQDLLERVAARLNGSEDKWLHAGTLSVGLANRLHPKLALMGIADRFLITGVVTRPTFRSLVEEASAVLIPRGGQSTGITLNEFKTWSVDVEEAPGASETLSCVPEHRQPVNVRDYVDELLA